MYNTRERKPGLKNEGSSGEIGKHLSYKHRLNFYDIPPTGSVTIEEFETSALSRLRVLAEIESCFARNRSFEDLSKVIKKQCDDHLPLHSNSAPPKITEEERKRDVLGHFVLRLAFCRSEELRRRFIKAETTLFRVRWYSDDTKERSVFVESQNFKWETASQEEKTQYADQLNVLKDKSTPDDTFYKFKWTRVADLVEKRKVFLKKGIAYVSSQHLPPIIFEEFQIRLERALDWTAQSLPELDEDTRLIPILDNLSQGLIAGISGEWSGATGASGEEITAEMVDELARRHFPACMRNLHESLRRDKHLKHFGRLQYGLFLKVLGLSIDEAITFWRRSFSNIQEDKFNKEYKYNIRHSYGLEGKRANYPAKSCQQILISDQPSSGDSHGCPYRHFSGDNLQSALLSMYSAQGLTAGHLPEIMQTVNAGHYHVACTRVFEITHASQGVKKGEGIGGGESVTHPNQYASKSRALEKDVGDGDVVMG